MISFLTKMYIRYLGFGLLIWFPGALHAQHATPSCSAPRLDGGFFSPKQETYSDETQLTYTCNDGRKPTVKGWWATSTCQHGTWSPEPQCIDEKACIAPDIPNAKYRETQSGWYNDGHNIRITCSGGYDAKDNNATTTCIDGIWSFVPVCEKSIDACGEPPQIPHAVIIHQGYQDFFAADTRVRYECEDGYTVEAAEAPTSVYCIAGNWTEGPVCNKWVNNCGKHPVVPNGDVVENNEKFVRYQCARFYELVGPERVECYSDGTWSTAPTCKASFCSVDTRHLPDFIDDGVKFIRDGGTVELECVKKGLQFRYHYSVVRCKNGNISFSKCCTEWERDLFKC